MKYISLLILLTIGTFSYSQAWKQHLPENRNQDSYTLQDYKDAFNKYWEGKEIENGYYFERGEKKKAHGWKQFKRWEYLWESRVEGSEGVFPNQRQYDEAYRQYNQSDRNGAGAWESFGPYSSKGGYAGVGRINLINFHPTDPDMFWVTTPGGGLWATEDAGNSWRPLTDGNEVLATTAVAVPSDFDQSQIIYLGTGDMDFWNFDNGIGLIKSYDAGESWQSTGLTFNIANRYSVNRILIHPEDDNTLYVATTNGIYKSTDEGETFDRIILTNYISDMEFISGDPSTIIASSKSEGKILKITNNGKNQEIVYDEAEDGAQRVEITSSVSHPNIIYGVVSNPEDGLKHIIKSEDFGDSFQVIFEPEPSEEKPNLLTWARDGDGDGGQGWYDLCLAVHPYNPDILHCGGVNNWRSSDGGISWQISSHWSNGGEFAQTVHADKHYLAYNGDMLYECNDGGLYRTADGIEWDNISNGIVNSEMYKIGVAQTAKYDVMAGLQDNGSKSYYNGEWSDVLGGDGMDCMIDYSDNNVQYGSSQYGGLRMTTDHWENKHWIKPDEASGAWVTPFIQDPVDPATIFAGYQHIFKSTDQGENWEIIFERSSTYNFRHLAISQVNNQVIYAAEQYIIWRSIDGGLTWEDVTGDLPNLSEITSVSLKYDDPYNVFITYGGFNDNSVFESTEGGNKWKNISTGLPPIPARTVVHNGQNTLIRELYVGTEFGVYFKLGEGNWQLFNQGMPKVMIGELEIYYDSIPSESLLRAGTYGRGLWESPLYSATGPPEAEFEADKTVANKGQAVRFTDKTVNSPLFWDWQFEGGSPSESDEPNPLVIYEEEGTYKVSLSVINISGNSSIVKEEYITITCDEDLNYLAEKAESLEGNYQDISADAIMIALDNNDDANSLPIDIGFEFEYNCQTFDQFILNTNGFIKLGNTPPSRPDLFFVSSTQMENGPFNSTDPADNNLIIPFCHDLTGENAEYSVSTVGEEPNRISTIQFKDLRDKGFDLEIQFDAIEFQIKLYETSNQIEFVYGDWISTEYSSTFNQAACGLKGQSNENNHILSVVKYIGDEWSMVDFQNNNYNKNDFGVSFGNESDWPLPDRGRTFRFTPIHFEDIAVGNIFALHELPGEFGNPEVISAVVYNKGYKDAFNIEIELSIEGANSHSYSKSLPEIPSGERKYVSFPAYQSLEYGNNEISVIINEDDDSNDNVNQINQLITKESYNYASDEGADSAWGDENGDASLFLAKFQLNGLADLDAVNAFVFDNEMLIGERLQAVVLDNFKEIIASSEEMIIEAGHINQWNVFPLTEKISYSDNHFYAGIRVFESVNAESYYPLGVQEENPSRTESFYRAGNLGEFMYELGQDFGFRLMIGANVISHDWLEGIATAKDTFLCAGKKARVSLPFKPGDIQWQKSISGIGGWQDVEGGFGANLKTFISDALERDTYFRAKITLDDESIVFSNSVYVQVGTIYNIEENVEHCYGLPYVFPDGETIYSVTENVSYSSKFTSSLGCDSTIITHLNVIPAAFISESVEICRGESYVLPDGNIVENILENMSYYSSFDIGEVCDSVVETKIVIKPMNLSINETDTILSANLEGASYQWFDCETNSILDGEINQGFTPSQSGSYAVIIDNGECTDMSECIVFIHSKTKNLPASILNIYPNPSSGHLTVESEEHEIRRIKIIGISGVKFIERMPNEDLNKQQIDLYKLPNGIYLVKVLFDEGEVVKKLIVE